LQVAIDSPEMDTTAGAELLPLLLTRQISLLDVNGTLDELRPLIERILSLTASIRPWRPWKRKPISTGVTLLTRRTGFAQTGRSYLDQAFASTAGL
jgi:hypothetical protein